jgi:hypothetical protein
MTAKTPDVAATWTSEERKAIHDASRFSDAMCREEAVEEAIDAAEAFAAVRVEEAYARGRAEGEVATISHFGLHRSGVRYGDLEAEVARLSAEVAAAQQLLNIALDGEEVSRGDLAYDVDTVVDQRDEARQEIVRLAQKRLELRAEVAAAEQREAELVKGLRKAVKDPETEWVDANIVRLLLRNAQVDGGVS